jgi:NADPH-dependent curcumin reductase CurA
LNASASVNRRILLKARPTGAPTPDDFILEAVPRPDPGAGQMLLKTLFLSLDPYMRGRMSDAPSYAPPVALGEVMVGGTIARVETTKLADFKPGDLVVSMNGWQDYALSDGIGISKLPDLLRPPSLALGVLGMPGFTAMMGLLDIGQPVSGETLVVGAATGAVGSVVGQIGKIKGCRVVGIAGGSDKCRYAVETLGFDACIDHRAADFRARLAASCPAGIDIYFENIGGAVFDAVMTLLNPRARIPVCGLVATYNSTALPAGPDRLAALSRLILTKRLKMQGFIIYEDYARRFPEFRNQMQAWLDAGAVVAREDIVDGLENAPQAFIGLLQGKNFGKLVVRVS